MLPQLAMKKATQKVLLKSEYNISSIPALSSLPVFSFKKKIRLAHSGQIHVTCPNHFIIS